MKYVFAAAASLLAAPVFAQEMMVEVGDRVELAGIGIVADIADDLDVFDAEGRMIGEVEEIVGPDRDTAEAVVVDFEDAIQDYGREDRVIPLSAFSFDGAGLVLAEGTDVSDLAIWRD